MRFCLRVPDGIEIFIKRKQKVYNKKVIALDNTFGVLLILSYDRICIAFISFLTVDLSLVVF